MANEHKKGLNDKLVCNDLEKCCRSEAACGTCQGTDCTIGFAK